MSASPRAMRAARRLRDTVLGVGATMAIATGESSVTICKTTEGPRMSATTYADPETGELSDDRPIKDIAVEAATRLVDEIWGETQRNYDIMPLTALKISEKIVNAVLAGAVKEHVEILAEPLKPRQTKLPGVD